MDILAARKKAAELAKARQDNADAKAAAGPAERTAPEPVGGFPPLPDTSYAPDDPGPAREPQQADARREPAAAAETAPPDAADASDAPASAEQDAGPDAQPEQEELREMLAFLLGTEEYVVPVDAVREVLTPREITPVPHTPEHILGVCSLRGDVLPIVDLNRRLGLEEPVRDEKARIIVANVGPDDRVGLFVDRVKGVVRFPDSAVRPTPENVEQGSEFLQGIARRDDRLFILLDVKKAAGA